MSSAVVQKGTALKVAFGSFAYTGYIPEDGLTISKPREVEEIKDENGAVTTQIISAPRQTITVSLMIKDSGGSITPPAVGDTITFTHPDGTATSKYMCTDASVELSRSYSKLNLTIDKPDDITYS